MAPVCVSPHFVRNAGSGLFLPISNPAIPGISAKLQLTEAGLLDQSPQAALIREVITDRHRYE
jgi:hypothetical protein